ncbi:MULTISPECIES: hypothetical protein [unclassified Serratia (in: enterobacteria)]|uniref:hypothetical protein n=1 Tax=unclassified Serratia (in: enterobacteria) TaxID=2647522 RepID=UPI000469C7BB|nr:MULTISPECIES: hypothetical protein [unclassified Serratia (in: enterobacteria)]
MESDIYTRFNKSVEDFCRDKSIGALKRIVDIYIEAYVDDDFIGDHDIHDECVIFLSQNPREEMIEYLSCKKNNENNHDLVCELNDLINMIKLKLNVGLHNSCHND